MRYLKRFLLRRQSAHFSTPTAVQYHSKSSKTTPYTMGAPILIPILIIGLLPVVTTMMAVTAFLVNTFSGMRT